MMQADLRGWIFVPSGLHDGPLPVHYEAQESIVKNSLYDQDADPSRMQWLRDDNSYHHAWADPRFPYIITTHRLTQHHTAGGMSRWVPWLRVGLHHSMPSWLSVAPRPREPRSFCQFYPYFYRLNPIGSLPHSLSSRSQGRKAAYGYPGMGPYRGAQTEWVRIPFADANCLRLPGEPGDAWEHDFYP